MNNQNLNSKNPSQTAGAKAIRDALSQFQSLQRPLSMAQTRAIIKEAKERNGVQL